MGLGSVGHSFCCLWNYHIKLPYENTTDNWQVKRAREMLDILSLLRILGCPTNKERATPRRWLQVNRCPFFVAHLNVPSLSGTLRVSQVNAEFSFDTKPVTFIYLYQEVNRCPGSLVAHRINVPKISGTMRIKL
jgi:hypothetical protein